MPDKNPGYTAQKLSEFVAGIESSDIPEQTLVMAERCVLDLLASAIAGFNASSAKAARNFGSNFFPKGSSSVWFEGVKLSPSGASMVNSVASQALDLDDGNRSAGGHPGASIIPTCLAYAQSSKKESTDFLTAIVLGYEVAVRIARARDMESLDTFSTGRWCGFGAVASAGWLVGIKPEKMAQAFSIAGIYAPNQSASAYSNVGHATKEGIPWATYTGLAGLELAKQGYTGPLDILDQPDYFDSEKVLKGLGENWAIEQTYFKPYSCCRWIHAALDGLMSLLKEYLVSVKDIKSIEVETFKRAIGLKNEVDPITLEGAQFSIPYCLALMAVKGKKALQPLSHDSLSLLQVVDLAKKVTLTFDQEIENAFPEKACARLILNTSRGRLSRLVEYPFGDPANPMSIKDLEKKFSLLSGNKLSFEQKESFLKALQDLRKGSLVPVFKFLDATRLGLKGDF